MHSAHGNLVTLHAMLQNHYRAEDFFESAASAPTRKGKGDKRGYGPAFIPLHDAYNAQFPMSLVADRRNKRPRCQTANLFVGGAPLFRTQLRTGWAPDGVAACVLGFLFGWPRSFRRGRGCMLGALRRRRRHWVPARVGLPAGSRSSWTAAAIRRWAALTHEHILP